MSTMFIAFEGSDGVDKSNLAPLVASLIGGDDVEYRTKKHVSTHPAAAAKDMGVICDLLWPASGIPDLLDYPAQYWLLMQAAWYSLASALTVRPILAAGRSLVVDGWFYKFLAKASLDDIDPGLLRTAFADVAVPDVIVHLDADLSSIYDRAGGFTFPELGGYQSYAVRGRESFVHHQSRVRASLLSLMPADRVVHVPVVAAATPEDNAALVLTALSPYLVVAS